MSGDDRGRRRDVLVDVAVGDLDRALALVRLVAGEQLVEDDAGGVDVGAGVGAAVDDELGGEVGDGADQHAAGRGVLGVGADGLGEAEVGDLDPAAVGLVADQHVLRLHVAVDQAGAVGGGEGGDDRLEQRQRPGGRHRRLLADHVAQGVAGDVLHGQEDDAVVVALVVDADDVRVVELGGGPRLAHEALGEVVVVTQTGVHHLDRDRAVEPDVGGLVDTGHATARDAGADAISPVEESTDERVGLPARPRRGRARVTPLLDLHHRTGKDPVLHRTKRRAPDVAARGLPRRGAESCAAPSDGWDTAAMTST